MSRRAKALLLGIALVATHAPEPGTAAAPATDSGAAPDVDADTGLIRAPGWELVRAHCGGCHSYQLVTQQRGDETFWRDTIRWMQRTQNLWQIPADQEAVILGYLASQYDETDWGRRPPLPARLLPSGGDQHRNDTERPTPATPTRSAS
jgi:hypothetical protein